MTEADVWQEIGEEGFVRISQAFYAEMRTDDLVGAMYPEDDWQGAEERFRDYLLMRFGGQTAYLEKRGHPRLRARHLPFSIGEAERDRWLEIMGRAMKTAGISNEAAVALAEFFVPLADFMRNRPG